MQSKYSRARLFTMLLAVALLTLPALRASAFVIGNVEDLEALLPAPETSEPIPSNNTSPIARNLSFETYRNVTIIEELSAFDPEGDLLEYRIVKNPARGKVTLTEGSASFTYAPYENKKGKDSFTYVAVDSFGNTSEPAKVSIHIQNAKTAVFYADMTDNPAHRAAVRLAEEGVFVGECLGGNYFFDPETALNREEFLTMAVQTLGGDILLESATTGFTDDDVISVWAKSSIASALRAGMVTGSLSEEGDAVFSPQDTISYGEASALVGRLLRVTDVATAATAADPTVPVWLAQSVANLKAVGVVPPGAGGDELSVPLTRGQCAVMLSNALDVLDFRAGVGSFFSRL